MQIGHSYCEITDNVKTKERRGMRMTASGHHDQVTMED
jgi:hypothetical protein